MRPMLATAGTQPSGDDWMHEVKWDGIRVVADATDGRVRLTSRSGRDITVAFPELAGLSKLIPDALIDGEIIMLEAGVPSFAALSSRLHVSSARRASELASGQPVTLMAFDVMRLYGVSLLNRPLLQRRATLDKLDLPAANWARSPRYDDGSALWAATQSQGLEGVVSKRLSSPYQPGIRSQHWIKVAHHQHQACVVGGWRPEANSNAQRIGALLIGIPRPDGSLTFAGRVGSGIDEVSSRQLLSALSGAEAAHSPFAAPIPVTDARGARFARADVVIEVRHLGWTAGGRLRQPVFRGIRSDLKPAEVRREP